MCDSLAGIGIVIGVPNSGRKNTFLANDSPGVSPRASNCNDCLPCGEFFGMTVVKKRSSPMSSIPKQTTNRDCQTCEGHHDMDCLRSIMTNPLTSHRKPYSILGRARFTHSADPPNNGPGYNLRSRKICPGLLTLQIR